MVGMVIKIMALIQKAGGFYSADPPTPEKPAKADLTSPVYLPPLNLTIINNTRG